MRCSTYPRVTVHSPLARWREMGWGRRLEIQRPTPYLSPSPLGQGERELNAYTPLFCRSTFCRSTGVYPFPRAIALRLACPRCAKNRLLGYHAALFVRCERRARLPRGGTSHVNHSSPSPAGGRGISLDSPWSCDRHLQIAAITRAHGWIAVTHSTREFARVLAYGWKIGKRNYPLARTLDEYPESNFWQSQ